MPITSVRETLSPFFVSNKSCSLEEIDATNNKKNLKINKPWNDSSVAFVFPDEENAIQETTKILNNLILPERFSAIYHKDTKDIEFIWTALKIKEPIHDVRDRKFKFHYEGREYQCEYCAASSELMHLAHIHYPSGETTTSWRNLRSFDLYQENEKAINEGRKPFPIVFGEPVCFWIKNVEWDEDYIFNLASNINFYMNRFDKEGPYITIYPPLPNDSFTKQDRYVEKKFPSEIRAQKLDDVMLRFWEYSRSSTADEIQKFISNYRILEYASSVFIDDDNRRAIRKLLSSPTALNDLSDTTRKILGVVSSVQEFDRYIMLIERVVGHRVLWAALNRNKDFFLKDTCFDGGFVADSVLTNGMKEDEFRKKGVADVARQIRCIRNAVSHGKEKDQKVPCIITPVAKNIELLRPWADIVSIAAEEVIAINRLE